MDNDSWFFSNVNPKIKLAAFESLFKKERSRVLNALRQGIPENDIDPFGPALIYEAWDIRKDAKVDNSISISLDKWRTSIVTFFYGQDERNKRRYLTKLIIRGFCDSPWWKEVLAKESEPNTFKNMYQNYSLPSLSSKSMLIDFVWYYEHLQTYYDLKVKGYIKKYCDNGYGIRLFDCYPDEFLVELINPFLSMLFKKADPRVTEFVKAPFSTKEEQRKAIEKLLVPICVEKGLDLSDSFDGLGNPIFRPIFRENGSVDYVAAMRHFRYVVYSETYARSIAKKKGISLEKVYKEGFADRVKLSDSFVDLAVNRECSRDFLESIGVTETGIQIILDCKEEWLESASKREHVRSIVFDRICGNGTPSDEERFPAVLSSLPISFEFFAHQTFNVSNFVEGFKREENKFEASNWEKPFEDDLILSLLDRKNLKKLGLSQKLVDVMGEYRLNRGNITYDERVNFSILWSLCGEIHTCPAFCKKEEDSVDKDSSISDLYEACKNEIYKAYDARQRGFQNGEIPYSDGLLEGIFRIDLAKKILKNYDGDEDENPNLSNWVNLLPDDNVLISNDGFGNPLIPGYLDKKQLLQGIRGLKNGSKTNACRILDVVSILADLPEKDNPVRDHFLTEKRISYVTFVMEKIIWKFFSEWKNLQ